MEKANLLKLPLEITQQILEILVKRCSLDQAITLRLVCKKFDSEIIRALCVTEAIVDLGCRIKLSHSRFLSDYLIMRTMADQDYEHQLSLVIRDTINYILKERPEDESRRDEYTRALCIATIQSHGRWKPNDEIYYILKTPVNEKRTGLFISMRARPLPYCSIAENALAASAYLGIRRLCRKLIQDGVENTCTHFGHPLQIAAGNADLKTISLLLKGGMCTLLQRKQAVAEAASKGHCNVIELLFDLESNPLDSPIPELWLGSTYHWAICRAAEAGHSDTIQYLIRQAAICGIVDTRRKTIQTIFGSSSRSGAGIYPLHEVILYSAVLEGQEEVARAALVQGANPNATQCAPGSKCTPFEMAIKRGYEGIVQLLLQYGAAVRPPGRVPSLIFAVRGGWTRIAWLLIGNGAEVNPRANRLVEVPLMAAVESGQAECLLLLLENGADFNYSVHTSSVAMAFAVSRGYTSIVQILTEYGIKPEPSKFRLPYR